MTTKAGIALIVVGAILTFALTADPFHGLDLHVVGVILILAGLAGLLLPLLLRNRPRGEGDAARDPRDLPRHTHEQALRQAVADDIAAVRTDDQYFRSDGADAKRNDL